MSNKIYNILWVDDEHEKLDATIRSAKDFGLKLIPFKSLEGGMTELEKNLVFFDGVLLDAKFFEKEDDVPDTEDTEYVHRAKERILQLPKKFDIHILTGQAEAFDDKTFNKVFTKVYRKGIEKDEDALFESLRNAAENQIDFQIRHKYQHVFEICNDKYLGDEVSKRLMDILKDIENDVIDKSPEDLLNQLRKIIEKIFTKLNQIGIIPNEIIQNKGWINGSSLFLSGKHIDFIHNQDFIHPTIAEVIFRLLNITQDASHGEGDLRLKVDDYMKEMKSPYLYKSCVFQLLELLVWFKNFIDNNPDSDKNKLKWTKKEIGNIVTDGDWVTGKITRLAENGWGTFKPHSGTNTISIMPKMVKDYSLNVDDEVEIISEPSPDGSKTYITALKKVAE